MVSRTFRNASICASRLSITNGAASMAEAISRSAVERVDVFLDGRDVGGVWAIEPAAGALEPDRARFASGFHVGRFDAVAEWHSDRTHLVRRGA